MPTISRIFPRAVLVVVALFACSLAFSADSNSAALLMVSKLRLGENMGTMGYQLAKSTLTYRMIVKDIGSNKADVLLKDELDKARPKYQDRWNANLAASYAEYLAPNELASLAEKGKASPFVAKFMDTQRDVGASMQLRSKDLLVEFATEGLSKAFSTTVPKNNPAGR